MKMDVHVVWDDGIEHIVNSKDLRRCGAKWRQNTSKFKVGERVKMWCGVKWYFGCIALVKKTSNSKSSNKKLNNKKVTNKLKSMWKGKYSNPKLKMAHTVSNEDNTDSLHNIPLSKYMKLNNKENIDSLDDIPLSKLRNLYINERNNDCQSDIVFPNFEKNILVGENVFIKYEENIYDVNTENDLVLNSEPQNTAELMPRIIHKESDKGKNAQLEINERKVSVSEINKSSIYLEKIPEFTQIIKEEEICPATGQGCLEQQNFNIVLSEPFTLTEDLYTSDNNFKEVKVVKEMNGEEMKKENENQLIVDKINKTDDFALSTVNMAESTLNESRKRHIELEKSKNLCKFLKPKRYRNFLLKPCSVLVETNIASQMKPTDIYKVNHDKILSGLNAKSEELSQVTNPAITGKQLINKQCSSTVIVTNKISPKKGIKQYTPRLQNKSKPDKSINVSKYEPLQSNENITTADFINHNFSKLITEQKLVLEKSDNTTSTKINPSKSYFPLISFSKSIKESTITMKSISQEFSLTSSSLNVLKSCISLENTSLASKKDLSDVKKILSDRDILNTNSNLDNAQRKYLDSSNTITKLPIVPIQQNGISSNSAPQENSSFHSETNIHSANLKVNYTTLKVHKSSLSDQCVTPKNKSPTIEPSNDLAKFDILNSKPYTNKTCDLKKAPIHFHGSTHSALEKKKEVKMKSTTLECLDGAPPFIREVFECENIREGFIKTDLMFVLGLIPDIEEMTDKQKMNFQLKVIDILTDVLDDPQLQIKRSQ